MHGEHTVYRSRNTMLYTWNLHNGISQCYLNLKKSVAQLKTRICHIFFLLTSNTSLFCILFPQDWPLYQAIPTPHLIALTESWSRHVPGSQKPGEFSGLFWSQVSSQSLNSWRHWIGLKYLLGQLSWLLIKLFEG